MKILQVFRSKSKALVTGGGRQVVAAGQVGAVQPFRKDLPAGRDPATPGLYVEQDRSRVKALLMLFLLFLPTIAVTIYFGLFAAPRYVSEAKYVVRAATSNKGINSLFSFLQATGLTRSDDNAFSVGDYMTSRDAIRELMKSVPLLEIYNRNEADFLARYPSFIFSESSERFYRYFQWMISVTYSETTSISTLQVQAFRAEDAHDVAKALLDLSEKFINTMNDRYHQDSLRVSTEQVKAEERRLVDAQIALTNFRNRELMIDPAASTSVVSEVIKRLSSSLAETQLNISEVRSASPNSPQLPNLQQRASAINTQIEQERARFSAPSHGLAGKIAEFERLALEREFAKKALTAATTALERARLDARQKQLYLERVVEPNLPDYAAAPASLRWVLSTFGLNVLVMFIGWLFLTGIREHAAVR